MSNNNFVKGMAIGAATGTAIGMIIAPKRKKHKSLAMGFDENYKAKNIKKYVVDHILYFYIIFDTLYL